MIRTRGFRKPATLAAALLLACPAAAQDKEDIEAARTAWERNCSSCHFIPDLSLESDRIWTEMLDTSS